MQANKERAPHFLPFAHLKECIFMQFNKKSSDFQRIFNLTVRILSGFFWILLLFAFDEGGSGILTVCAAIIHEFGHCAAHFLIGAGTALPHASLCGFGLLPRRMLSYKEEIFVAAGGPLANLLTFLLLLPLYPSEWAEPFALINLLCAASNLLPVKSYDGYRILSATLSLFEITSASVIIDAISFIIASAAVLISLYAIYFFDAGYWIFGVFFIFLLKEVDFSLKQRFGRIR